MLPISSKTLFRRSGLPIDILERELGPEGYLFPDEVLLEVLKVEANLKRIPFGTESQDGIGDFPYDWTEEDYRDFYERKNESWQVVPF